MCGIVGIVSNKSVSASIIGALKKLEYRGYDSAGISTISNVEINEKKCSGRVEELEKILFKTPSNGNIGIGHVRWATHGVANVINAHPHSSEQVSVVHNGIIENSDEIKKELEAKGLKFKSQTDTEVITLLITEALKNDDFSNKLTENNLSIPLKEAREKFEKEYLSIQLKKFNGNISKTANFVGMERSALHRKLKGLGIKEFN